MWFCRNLSQYEILHYCGERMHPQEVHRSVCYQEHCDIAMKIEHYLHVSSLLMEIHQHCNAFFFFYLLNFLLLLLSHFCLICLVRDLFSDCLSSQHLFPVVFY